MPQLRTPWPTLLNELVKPVPAAAGGVVRGLLPRVTTGRCGRANGRPTWCFTDPEGLRRLYPLLVRHAMANLSSGDILPSLGRRQVGSESERAARSAPR